MSEQESKRIKSDSDLTGAGQMVRIPVAALSSAVLSKSKSDSAIYGLQQKPRDFTNPIVESSTASIGPIAELSCRSGCRRRLAACASKEKTGFVFFL